MQFTSAQQATFKTWLDANASGLSDQAAADLANAVASPAYLAWRTVVGRTEIHSSTAFDWTRVDNLSVGKARIWDWMFASQSIRPWMGNIRSGINSVWVGTQPDLDVRAAVNAACQRPVTNLEKLFVTQTTTGPSQSGNRGAATNADTLGIGADGQFLEGKVTDGQVAEARG